MAGGGGSPIARVIGQIDAVNSPRAGGGTPGFVSPSQLGQQAAYQPNIANAAPQITPLAQQMMQRSMAPQPMSGLPAALLQMQGQFNRPMMRGPMPTYQSPALAYKPNMAPAMEALNRVQPSVYKTDLDAARARIAELEAAQQQTRDENTRLGFSGG
jgi:hypothetical protein